MITLGLDYAWYPEKRHQELLAEAERMHLVQEAIETAEPRHPITSKVLVYLGKKLAAFGANLEERYSFKQQTETAMDQQTTPCS
jgi:hypothetical protein